MSTSIKPDDFLASLTKWGVNWRFYKNKEDWLTHNRNGASNNVPPKGTPGGYGPLRGAVAHNTASTSQVGMLAYLYNGDPARQLPGPLCNWAVTYTGEVVLMGWGTSNATGPGDPIPNGLVLKNAMPLDREIVPRTAGPSDPQAVLYAPYYFGWEACHAAEGPTATQYQAIIRAGCACLDVLGGPKAGYSGGSVIMHRELTTTRSDPQGVGKAQIRRDIDKQFAAGPPTKPPEPPVTLKPSVVKLSVTPESLTLGEAATLTASATPALPGVFVFQYMDSTVTTWTEIRRQKTANGQSVLVMKPYRNTTYRVAWLPDDPAYQDWIGATDTAVVVDLLRLMTETRALQVQVANQQAQIAALQAQVGEPTTPPTDTLPGG